MPRNRCSTWSGARTWTPLPGTRREAEAIQRLFPRAQLLLGPNASKDALLKLATPGLLHIATHGFFLEEASTLSPSHFNGAEFSRGATSNFDSWQNPLHPQLRSGLVLAGAQPGLHLREDSLVTALELASLDLWGTQLVVLSACDTGRGDFDPVLGIQGLRRALVVAGAETLVTSLWKLNDEATQQLMEGYYRRLSAGLGRTTALNEVMRELRQKQPHPHFWAPFIAVGQDSPLRGLTPD